MEILGLVDIPLWLLLLLTTTLLLYVYGTWNHGVWSSQGVPGPKPWPLLGNVVEVLKKSHFQVHAEWQKKYGRVCGNFYGVQPVLNVTDLEILREVLVKNFNNFVDRRFIKGTIAPTVATGLFFARGTAWKRIRQMMTPIFSSSKLKLMSHYIGICSTLLSKNLENKARAKQSVDVKDVFGSFTMDVIAGTAFGLETNSQTQEGEPFVTNCKKIFEGTTNNRFNIIPLLVDANSMPSSPPICHMLKPPLLLRACDHLAIQCNTQAFPFLGPTLGKVGRIVFRSRSRPARFFISALDKMVEDRRKETTQDKNKTDLLQMLVEAEADADYITDRAKDSDLIKSHRRMTKEEILGQGFIVMVAGYETTATTLQYLTYNLTMHPEVQERVFDEIQENLGNADPTYSNVSSLKYLDAAIRETLRMFTPVAAITRVAMESTTVKGVHIPAGSAVIIPIHCIMHDPEHFHDPEKFLPERFLDENRAKLDPLLVDLPFGYGPRQCIGMRLALIEIKFAAVRMFRQFRFLRCADTPGEVSLGKAMGFAIPNSVIKVNAELRTA